jgi:hypothetical protein
LVKNYLYQAPHDRPEGIIEPDDGGGSAPDEIAHDPVIAIGDPLIVSCRLRYPGTKVVDLAYLPVGQPIESIELDVAQPMVCG